MSPRISTATPVTELSNGPISTQLHPGQDVVLHHDSCRPEIEALVDHVEALRLALCTARRERPFSLDAIVVLPDHFIPQALRGPAATTTRRKSRAARSVYPIMFEAAYRLQRSEKLGRVE